MPDAEWHSFVIVCMECWRLHKRIQVAEDNNCGECYHGVATSPLLLFRCSCRFSRFVTSFAGMESSRESSSSLQALRFLISFWFAVGWWPQAPLNPERIFRKTCICDCEDLSIYLSSYRRSLRHWLHALNECRSLHAGLGPLLRKNGPLRRSNGFSQRDIPCRKIVRSSCKSPRQLYSEVFAYLRQLLNINVRGKGSKLSS